MTQTVGAWPEEIDVEVYAGEPVDFTVPALDDDDVAQDVTGWSGVAQVRRYPGGPLLHAFTLTLSAAGVQVTATGTQTAAWAAWSTRAARWDLWITEPDEDPRPLCRGRVLVRTRISEVS
jgi:hypothetical protein